ncbi:hypothetical protein QJS10_CPB20g00100 [Acorus calamus]|uniref:Uncharacterized protein n=1 Tax=Acorus calamus TaxID=4465 RepID=A0AAV9CC83_ACOCL|nr:hypothetical protein QJS10_CPB20g00100 [Acorus calamus]
MGDKSTLAKARQELEDMYLGVPDESVNLTFSDLPSVQQNCVAERKKIETIQENMCIEMKEGLAIRKSPSIDFARGLRATNNEHGENIAQVCGRIYCRKCVSAGMGEMTEGRKCIECLGRRFSQRYIQKAGKVGCYCSRYSSMVKQQELMWAEKGPRRTGERRYGQSEAYGPSGVVSRSRSPVTPVRAHYGGTTSPTSFVASTAMATHFEPGSRGG